MNNVTIRYAKPEDAAEIANVHINSWREAYVGLINQEFLDERPLHFKNRYELWKKVILDLSNITYVAECSENGIVGFVNGGKSRDPDMQDYAEIYSIYLLKKYHHQKIGLKLLNIYFSKRKQEGFKKAYLWVLEDNPTIAFYEKTGGKYSNKIKEAKIGNQKVNELCFTWESI